MEPAFFAKVRRIAKQRGISEADLMREALDAAARQRPQPPDTDDALYIPDLDEKIPLSKVRLIMKALGQRFGGKTKLSKEERRRRAQTAARARWGKPPEQ